MNEENNINDVGVVKKDGGDDQHKMIAVVGYILPFLFFIPLLSEAKNNPYAKFHANQQLNLLLFWIAGQLIASLTTVILIGLLLYPVVMVIGVIFMIMGIINSLNMEQKELPVIGKYRLLK